MKKLITLMLSISAFGLILIPQPVEAEMSALTDEQMGQRYLVNVRHFFFRVYLKTQKDMQATWVFKDQEDDFFEDIEDEIKLKAHISPVRLSSIPVGGKFRDRYHTHRKPDVYNLFEKWWGFFLRVDLLTTERDWFGNSVGHEIFTYIREGSTIHSGKRFGQYGIIFEPVVLRWDRLEFDTSLQLNREIKIIVMDANVWVRPTRSRPSKYFSAY